MCGGSSQISCRSGGFLPDTSYHAVEHLKDAFDTAHGTDSPTATAQFKKYRHLLRHEPDGVNRVIRTLVYLRSKHPGNERIAQVLGYFRGNRHRMGYADANPRGGAHAR